MPVRLIDVAKKANVSVATVSRVINNKDRVAEETREKVMQAVKILQFYPNDSARSLRNNSTKTVAVIVPDLSNHFYSSVIKGLESVMQQQGYSVLICNTNEELETEKAYTHMLLQKRISGLVIATVGGNSDFYQQYESESIPVVFFDNKPDLDRTFDFVSIDNVIASFQIVEYLISLGHKDIAVLTGQQSESTACERLQGWNKAMQKHDLPVNESHIGIGHFTIESGVKLMRSLLSLEHRPTAVFATNNFLAYGATRVILEANLRIPEDIAIACFDALDQTGLMRPQLTTSIQPSEEIGTIAGKLLLKKIESPENNLHENIIVEPQFLIRESTCKTQ